MPPSSITVPYEEKEPIQYLEGNDIDPTPECGLNILAAPKGKGGGKGGKGCESGKFNCYNCGGEGHSERDSTKPAADTSLQAFGKGIGKGTGKNGKGKYGS